MAYNKKKFSTGRKRNRRAQDRRRESATERQTVKRTVTQRLERLDKGGYAAVRERTKLAAKEV